MRQLIINRLALYNFKGIRQTEATFSSTGGTVTGDNGAGKSTIADAFSWLLFGKNAAGVEKFSIKTLDERGEVIPHLSHTVEADFTLLDRETGEIEQIRARRTYAEDWTTPAGETAPRLSGHHTDYYWNDIPVKKGEYEEKVAATIAADIFSIITDPRGFLALPWDEQRNRLSEIAGEVTDAEVAATNPAFAAMFERAKGATLDQYTLRLKTQRKKISAELDSIPARKDELQRATPAAPDYESLQARQTALEKKLADIDAAAVSIAERNRQQYQRASEIQTRINEQEKIRQMAVHEAEMQRQEANQRARRKQDINEARIREIQDRIASTDRSEFALRALQRDIERTERQAADIERKKEELKARFLDLYAQTYTPGTLICPRYGHQCTDPTACSKGEAEFNEGQIATLNRWQEEGRGMAAEIKRLQQQAAGWREEHERGVAEVKLRRAVLEGELETARQEQALHPAPDMMPEVNPADIPAWREAAGRIEALRKEYAAIMAEPTSGAYTELTHPDAKRHAQMELDEVKRRLALRDVIETNRQRQQELDRQGSALAQQKADIEKELYLAECFTVAKMDAIEEKVNGYFRNVRFRLFKTQVNGTRKADCIATVGGVPYRDVNTAGQINAGLDVIRTLTGHYGFAAPIFVDNCESVARLDIPEGAQVIRLIFEKGKPLTVSPDAGEQAG